MTTAIISGIVVPILGFALWYWRRKLEIPQTPAQQNEKLRKELHNAIGSGSNRSINDYFDKRLHEIQDSRLGQRDSANPKK